jgi:hypothetical protein
MHRPQNPTGGSSKKRTSVPSPPRSPDKAEGRIRGERMSDSSTRAMEAAHPGCAPLIRATRVTRVARTRPKAASGTGMPAARIDASRAEGHGFCRRCGSAAMPTRTREARAPVSSSTRVVRPRRPRMRFAYPGYGHRPRSPDKAAGRIREGHDACPLPHAPSRSRDRPVRPTDRVLPHRPAGPPRHPSPAGAPRGEHGDGSSNAAIRPRGIPARV